MNIYIGGKELKDLYAGSKKVKEVYYEKQLVRPTSKYQAVEYIQSNKVDSQYIDTGLNVSGNVKVEYKFMPVDNVTSSNGVGYCFLMDNGRPSDQIQGFGSGNSYFSYGGAHTGVTLLQKDSIFTDIIGNDGCTRNGGSKWIPGLQSYPTPDGTLKLFVSQRNGTIREYFATRIYYFKRWDNGVLTQHLIPCYRKSDNAIGMYNLIDDVFYENKGSGSFTKGADV